MLQILKWKISCVGVGEEKSITFRRFPSITTPVIFIHYVIEPKLQSDP